MGSEDGLIGVRLSDPVGATSLARLHDWSRSDLYQVGDTVEVLVNADHPDYAEVPGRPATGSHGWIFVLGLAALTLATTVVVAVRQARPHIRPQRTEPPPATAPPPVSSHPTAPPLPRKLSPGRLAWAGGLAAIAAGCVAVTVHVHAVDERSPDTQHHGVSAGGVVVERLPHANNTNYAVQLDAPIGGTSRTILYPHCGPVDAGCSGLKVGLHVSVLVDPKDTSYAELPGMGKEFSPGWLIPLCIALVLAGFSVAVIREGLQGGPKARAA